MAKESRLKARYGVVLFLFGFSILSYSQTKEEHGIKEIQPDLNAHVDTIIPGELPVGLNTPSFEYRDAIDEISPTFTQPNLPPVSAQKGTIMLYPSDYFWGGFQQWNLHEGFNASLSMGVTCGFGKNQFPGVGFGTSLAGMYAKQITDRFSLAGGMSVSHLTWNGRSYNDFGVSIVAGYKLTDRVSLYAYGNKSLSGTAYPPFLYPVLSPDKFGGLIHFKVNQSFSFSVGIEERSYPQR